MIIHKSHSKKDLYDIIKVFHFPITDKHITKTDLVNLIKDTIHSNLFNIVDNNKYLIDNKEDLVYYLISVNPKKRLSVKDKKQLIMDCKRINQYSSNHFTIDNTTFKTEEEVKELINKCKEYGEIPTVRKMIKRYNENPMLSPADRVKVNVSKIVQKELDDNRIVKKVFMKNLKIIPGPHLITFN